ncbi:unknown [Suid gammaherpesvirus 3]|uniref:Uncharacterized protein n=1 Tax=Suid gammaherpesvirus 3 TaxID=1960249 RepID=Q8JJP4_9GAMA|nr:unknown [Porcine lymphotropic herpesvirus 1]AAM22154.1 unknown [Porcine lymphotropic herpesvirus 1]
MAQSTKGAPGQGQTMAQLAAQLAQLQMENRNLKRQIRKSVGHPEDISQPKSLNPRQKQALISSYLTKFSSLATKKLEFKLATLTAPLQTKEEIEAVLEGTTIRLHLTLQDLVPGRLSKEMKTMAHGSPKIKGATNK